MKCISTFFVLFSMCEWFLISLIGLKCNLHMHANQWPDISMSEWIKASHSTWHIIGHFGAVLHLNTKWHDQCQYSFHAYRWTDDQAELAWVACWRQGQYTPAKHPFGTNSTQHRGKVKLDKIWWQAINVHVCSCLLSTWLHSIIFFTMYFIHAAGGGR